MKVNFYVGVAMMKQYKCDVCGTSDFEELHVNATGYAVCNKCQAHDNMERCRDCWDYFDRADTHYIETSGYYVCDNCFDKGYFYCAECGCGLPLSNHVVVNDEEYCIECGMDV